MGRPAILDGKRAVTSGPLDLSSLSIPLLMLVAKSPGHAFMISGDPDPLEPCFEHFFGFGFSCRLRVVLTNDCLSSPSRDDSTCQ